MDLLPPFSYTELHGGGIIADLGYVGKRCILESGGHCSGWEEGALGDGSTMQPGPVNLCATTVRTSQCPA